MTLVDERAITNDVLKFRKIIEFQSSWTVMNCQWIVYSAKSSQFVSYYSSYIKVRSLKKSSFCSLYLQERTRKNKKNPTSDQKTEIRNIQVQYTIIIWNTQLYLRWPRTDIWFLFFILLFIYFLLLFFFPFFILFILCLFSFCFDFVFILFILIC